MASVKEADYPRRTSLRKRASYSVRLRNGDKFAPDLVALLLYLHGREVRGQVTEICDLLSSAHVPARVADRYLEMMVQSGMITVSAGPGRRFRKISLSDKALAVLEQAKLDDEI